MWNKENRFTGWIDVDLSAQGMEEAHRAGQLLKEKGYQFDVAFTSGLKRAQHTLGIILDEIGQSDLTTYADDALNERMYGDLQGMNKDEARERFGEEQVHIWRRSYDVPPPAGESLKDTGERVMPYFHEEIKPYLQQGKNVIIAAHGNSLRSLIKYLEGYSDADIINVEIPTGTPKVYELDDTLQVLRTWYLD